MNNSFFLKEKVSGIWMEGEKWIPAFVGMTNGESVKGL